MDQDITRNPGNARPTEYSESERRSDVATYKGIIRPKRPGDRWFEITAKGVYVTVYIRDVGGTVAAKWGEAYARNGYGEINPPELGTEVDVTFDNGIMTAMLAKTGHAEYSPNNPPPLYPGQLKDPVGTRLSMHGADGNVRLVDKHRNVEEVILGHHAAQLTSQTVALEGPATTVAQDGAAQGARHSASGVVRLGNFMREIR